MPPRRTLSTPTMMLLAVVAIGFLAMPFLPDPREDWTTREGRYSTPEGLARYAEVALATVPDGLDLAPAEPALRVVVTGVRVDVDDIGWFLALPADARDAVAAQGSADVTAEGVKTVLGVPDKQVGVDWVAPDPSVRLTGLAAAAKRHRTLQALASDTEGRVNVLFDVATPWPAVVSVLSTLADAGFTRFDAILAGDDALVSLPLVPPTGCEPEATSCTAPTVLEGPSQLKVDLLPGAAPCPAPSSARGSDPTCLSVLHRDGHPDPGALRTALAEAVLTPCPVAALGLGADRRWREAIPIVGALLDVGPTAVTVTPTRDDLPDCLSGTPDIP